MKGVYKNLAFLSTDTIPITNVDKLVPWAFTNIAWHAENICAYTSDW